MRILKKIIFKFRFKFIKLLDGINNEKFTRKYVKLLMKQGVKFNGMPNYIASNAYLDGTGLNKITIGKQVVISRNVTLLTHDFSIRTALIASGESFENVKDVHINKEIVIGDNVFIGFGAIILPGTTIEDDCIIGAGAVVKGLIKTGSVVIGNPAYILKDIKQIGHKDVEDKKIF